MPQVVGVGKGSASVLCVSEDNSGVMATYKVSVLPKIVKGKTYPRSGMRREVTRVATIGTGAFNNLPRLASVTLGAGVKKVGSGAFVKAPELTTVTVRGKLLKKKASVKGVFKGSKAKKTVTMKVPRTMRKTFKKVFTKANLSCPKKVVVK